MDWKFQEFLFWPTKDRWRSCNKLHSRKATVKTKKQFTRGIVELGFVIKQTQQMEKRLNNVFIFNSGIVLYTSSKNHDE